ncbi:MAG: PAS domain S-box protein [Deltaproteobacteria bacterium]|nr:PAS domain S-box protein [Deltaproteobacteria bacterium]
MAGKPHHKRLEERIRQLEEEVAELKRAEETLRIEKAYFEHLFDSAPEAIVLADKDHRITRTNAQFSHLFGYTPEETAGRTCDDLIAPAERFNEASDITLRVGHGEAIRLETARCRKDGSPVFVELMAAPVRVGDEHIGDYVSYRDVNERKLVAGALRESEAKYRLLAENVTDVIWTLSLQSMRFTYVSPSVLQMRGYTPQETMELTLEQTLSPESLERVVKTLQEELARETEEGADPQRFKTLEVQQLRKDGTYGWAEVTASIIRDVEGRPAEILGVTRDITERKRTEEALRQSEATLQSVFRAAPVGICIMKDRVYQSVNAFWCESFGYREEEILGKDTRMLYESDVEYERVGRVLYTGLLKQGLESTETRLRCSDGVFRDVVLTAAPLRSDDPSVGSVVIIHDVTERKRAEELLKESERRWRNILTSTPQIGVSLDPEARIVFANTHLLQLTGWKEDEILGEDWFDFFIPEDTRGEVKKVFHMAMHAQDALSFSVWENDILTRSGERRTVAWSNVLTKNEQGDVLNVTCLGIDLTERKRAEDKLRESEARFREIADLLPQAVYETDAQGILTYVNRYAFDLFGYTKEEFEKGLSVFQMLIPEDRDRAADVLQALLTGNPSNIDREYRALRKDGTSFPIEIYSSPIIHEGTTVGLRGILVDMTEHEEAVAEKEKLQEQLNQAQKMESVGRLAGGVAHDFNNMLGIIVGNAELAMMQMGPTEAPFKNIQEILKASQRSSALVNQLLTFARKQTVIPRVLDLNDTVSGMLKMLRRLIGEDIDLAWMPGHDLWHVKIDPSQIDQILANLTVNARDAIAGVGKITIETDNVTFDGVYCADHLGLEPGQYVLLAVSDNGSGMSKEALEHLFEPFFTTKELGKGTGLGLPSVYGAVKQNGGFVNVYSEPGKGTNFKIYLPRCEVKDAAMQREVQPEPLQRGTETVLMVEDEASILVIGKAMLETLGYKVLAADTPDKAIRLAEEGQVAIHLLFTDVVMPEMNGKELEGRIKAINPSLKCLYMSGYTANAIAHHGVLDEGVHFIHKPFTMKELATRVREALDKG